MEQKPGLVPFILQIGRYGELASDLLPEGTHHEMHGAEFLSRHASPHSRSLVQQVFQVLEISDFR